MITDKEYKRIWYLKNKKKLLKIFKEYRNRPENKIKKFGIHKIKKEVYNE